MKVLYNKKNYKCSIELTLDIIGGKWKVLILWYLKDGNYRFNELKSNLGNITQKVLTQQLRDLESHKIISRKSYDTIPPKVEYKLTKYGHSIIPILHDLSLWGEQFANDRLY